MLKKYLKTYRVLLSNSLSYEAQYRLDTIIKMLDNVLWIGLLFLIIEVIFSQTQSIAGWNKGEIYLMTVLWVLADELFVAFFGSNLMNLSNLVTDGSLDYYLTKPIAPLFLVSARIFLTRSFYRFLIQLGVLFWLVWRFNFAVTLPRVIFTILLVGAAVAIDFGRTLMSNTLSFWFLRVDNVNDAMGMIAGYGRYPLSIWPKTLKIIFLTALPVAFSGFIPTATLAGRWPWYGVLYAFLFAAFLFFIAVKFWNFALKRYSSASS